MQEIVKDIFTWSWFSEPHGYNFNGYLVCHSGGNLCIDPVEPTEDVLAELERRGVARIAITNRNHVRAANRVRERTGARTAIHPNDAAYARAQGALIDDELHVGQKIGPLVVIGVPGKSPGLPVSGPGATKYWTTSTSLSSSVQRPPSVRENWSVKL